MNSLQLPSTHQNMNSASGRPPKKGSTCDVTCCKVYPLHYFSFRHHPKIKADTIQMLSSDTGVSRSNTHKKVSSHGTGMFASHIRSSSSENGFSAADGSSCIRVLCYPQGRPGLGFRLLASLWPSPG